MTARVVALLGAESTGKTTLAQELAGVLRGRGVAVAVVAEYLREFCDANGRTPTPAEQHQIAAEQAARIEAAAAAHAFVIADTTPVMTAVYSDFVFGDRALYASALAWQRRQVALTLVTGLDLPWRADGLQRDGPQVRVPVDALLRDALAGAGIGHATIYGSGAARTAAALAALAPLLGGLESTGDARSAVDGAPFTRWRARCAECLQPDCEHLARLLPELPRTP
ncbi:AAA family ATPase [Rivibacter subsaxonicus]|uniref:Nicotinamide riboside kinase n=1 Tax=Rivibacter subsaxonicus TaxID=457575 RepID=A0A4Q7VMZ5_9BURK|nr:ATP-binding protein [Rivibacter subsaxonicus]RZT97703.1 nicotinamide riboside kinase [Rivibacter subsaxonicus]